MTYARYELITSDEVLTECKFMLGISNTTTYDASLRIYMKRALGEIPSFDLVEYKTAILPICDEPHKMAKLPCGFVRFSEPNSISLTDEHNGCYYPRVVNNVMFRNRRESQDNWNGDVQIANGYIYFDSNITASEVHIYYLSVLLDETDRPLIPQSHARTVQEFMMYQHRRTAGDNRWQENQLRWANGKRMLKGQSNTMDVPQKMEVFQVMNSLL